MSGRGGQNGGDADRRPLGIDRLDALLGGGLPEGNTVLVQGAPGTGKTLLGLQFLYAGATECDAPGLLVTFEEQPCRLHRDSRALGWDFERLEREGRLALAFTSPGVFLRELEADHYGRLAREQGLRRVVVDNLTALETLPGDESPRLRCLRLVNALRREGLTVMLLRELPTRDAPSPVLPEEYVADTIIQLDYRPAGNRRVRSLEILKHRGAAHSPDRHPFSIAPGGLHIGPSVAEG